MTSPPMTTVASGLYRISAPGVVERAIGTKPNPWRRGRGHQDRTKPRERPPLPPRHEVQPLQAEGQVFDRR